jgi:YVTN family beta-propeller protein
MNTAILISSILLSLGAWTQPIPEATPDAKPRASQPTAGKSEGAATTYDFDKGARCTPGMVPTGWRSEGTNQNGPVATWEVVPDAGAASSPNVLALSKINHDAGGTYNLCWTDEVRFTDGVVEVKVRADSGKEDQGGGPIWRVKDKDNYLVARYNPLEENFRVYYVKDGSRKQLATAKIAPAVPAGEWFTIRIEQNANTITCFLNGKKELEATDDHITEEGGIGLWTKADAAASFDDLIITPSGEGAPKSPGQPAAAPTAEGTPGQVLVVNTQDGSVSLIDIATMKELKRVKVGARPYGIAVSKDGKTVAVGVEDEEKVKFFSLPDFTPKGETPIGKMHNDHIILTDDGRHVLVANVYSDDVFMIDMDTMKEAARIEGCSAPHVVKYGPQRKLAYVTCKKVTGIGIIDPEARKLVKLHQINVNPRSLTFSPDEKKVYFGSFWVNGFFEMDADSGKVTRLFELPPPSESSTPQEVTYHGVEAVYPNIVLAANEGRSYIDAVDVESGRLLDRLTTDINKPCCIERIPTTAGAGPLRVLVSNIGDGTMTLVEVASDGKLKSLGRAQVGAAPKRVAFLPATSASQDSGPR